MIYSTISLALVPVISFGQPLIDYLADNPKNCAKGGKIINENCFFVKGNSEVLLGGYRLKSADLANKTYTDLEFACGITAPDDTGADRVRVEGQGGAAFKQTLADEKMEVTARLYIPPVKKEGGDEILQGKELDFSVKGNIEIKVSGKKAIMLPFSTFGECEAHFKKTPDYVPVFSLIQIDEEVTTGQGHDKSITRVKVEIAADSNDGLKWHMYGTLGVYYYSALKHFSRSFTLYNGTVTSKSPL